MEDRIRRLYEMFLRVLNFMTATAADFEDVPFVAPTVADLQEKTGALGTLGAAKLTATVAAKDSTLTRGDARDDLRDDLEYLAEVWRSIPDEAAGMENKFRVPRGNNDQALITQGSTAADEAAAPNVAAVLTAHGVAPAFFTALRAKVVAFEQAIGTAQSTRGERVGTNAAFDEPARSGKKLVDKLSPAVKREYRANPQKLAEWLVASHVERAPKRAKTDAPPGDGQPNAGTGGT